MLAAQGVVVARSKTVSGISSECADTTDQSCHNRFLTEVDWEERHTIAHDYLFANYVCSSGKQELGMGDCQLRSGHGQTRHMDLVMLAYSLLMTQLRQRRAMAWALERLTTIGQACRAVTNEVLRETIEWAIENVANKSQKPQHVMALLGLN